MGSLLAVVRNRNLALLLSGRATSIAGDSVYQIVLSVAIYRDSGGKSIYVGLLWLLFLIPSLAMGPIGGSVADRIGARRAMILADVARLILVVTLAFTLHQSNWAIVYPFVMLSAALGTIFSPAAFGLFATLTRPDERLGALGVLMQVQSLATIIGSLIAGAAANLVTPMLLLDGATFGVSVLTLWLIRSPVAEAAKVEGEEKQPALSWLYGFRLVASRPLLMFAVAVMALPELGSGALTVWFVPFSIHHVHLGDSGVGYLYTAINIGGVLGGLVTAAVAGSARLDQLLAASVAMGGIGLALFGLSTVGGAALVLAIVLGLVETVEYAAYGTLLQQAVPENAIGRASGALDAFFSGLILIGTALSGAVAGLVGLVAPIVILGGLTAAIAVAAWIAMRYRTADRPTPDSLTRIPAFATVSAATREWAAHRMQQQQFPQGAVVMHQGESGDSFYLIAHGTAEVEIGGGDHSVVERLGPGDFFGEIALLHDVPRTATVRATGPLTTYVLSREDFQELQNREREFGTSLSAVAANRLARSGGLRPTFPPRSG